jgi:spore germination cell wall hydrolase CwlJ-like protein
MKLRVFAAQTGLTRMVDFVSDADTRRLAVNTVAGLSVMAVVAVGLPALERTAERQADEHTWRLKARAFLEAEKSGLDAAGPAARLAALRSMDVAARDRAAVAPYQTFAPIHFKAAQEQHINQDCLSRAIYYEARSESVRGQLAVAEVVLNRVSHQLYPNNICGVVYEGTDRVTGLSYRGDHLSCQFSFTCDGSEKRRPPRGEAWVEAQRISAHAMMGLSTSVTGDATHYHANYVTPLWAPKLVHTQTIGSHIFYRFPDRGEAVTRRGA